MSCLPHRNTPTLLRVRCHCSTQCVKFGPSKPHVAPRLSVLTRVFTLLDNAFYHAKLEKARQQPGSQLPITEYT